MRKTLIIGMASLLLASTVLTAHGEPANSGSAPDWTLTAADGSEIVLSEVVDEQPVILFFWATWCPFCKALMPHLQSIRLEYGDQVEILAIQIRDKADAVAFIEEAGYAFTVLSHGDAVADLYDVYATPGVILVDPSMRMRFDLRDAASQPAPADVDAMSHGRKAAYRAPYWAAEIRKALDIVLQDED